MKIKRLVGGSLESNGYIISRMRGGSCYVIDPGYEPKRFIAYIAEQGLAMQGVILTHHHYDHVGGAEKLRDYFECPVMMHEQDAFVYRRPVDRLLADGDEIDLDGARSAYCRKRARWCSPEIRSLIPIWDGRIWRTAVRRI